MLIKKNNNHKNNINGAPIIIFFINLHTYTAYTIRSSASVYTVRCCANPKPASLENSRRDNPCTVANDEYRVK